MVSPTDNPLKRLIREIHRRSLWQVLGIFLLGGWVAFEVVQTLTEGLGLPEWFPALAVVLLIIGLPVVLATAFVQEGGPGRDVVGRDAGDVEVAGHPADVPSGGASSLFTWRNAILGGVAAFALLSGVGVGWLLFGGGIGSGASSGDAPTSIAQSIAVLPFDDLSPESDQQYFVEGLSEEIINALTQIRDLKVAARTSAFAFQDSDLDIRTIADSLGVANALEGSVRKDGDRIRIDAQLIEAESGFHLWSDQFDRDLTDIFAIQDEIARAITDQLQVTLAGSDQMQLVAEATGSAEAHEAYLRGRYLWNQRTEESLLNSITEFRRAIELDSLYAEAWSGLADSYLLVDIYVETPEDVDFRTNLEQGLIAAREAVSLAQDLGMAHASLGWGLFMTGEWESAEREFELAIELNPGYATAHQWYGYSLLSTGGAIEGVTHLASAMELDPVSPIISANLARALWVGGQTEEAIEQMRETTELVPGWRTGWVDLSWALLETGEYAEGLEAWVDRARPADADVQGWGDAYQAMIRYHETGESRTFADVPGRPLALIWMYALSGQLDRSVELFADLVRPGAYGWAAHTHVRFTSGLLGDHSRYQALLEEAGITW